MDHDGAWNLFFATGLPQAYLAGVQPDTEESEAPAEETKNGTDPQ